MCLKGTIQGRLEFRIQKKKRFSDDRRVQQKKNITDDKSRIDLVERQCRVWSVRDYRYSEKKHKKKKTRFNTSRQPVPNWNQF